MPDENTDFDNVLGEPAAKPAALKTVVDTLSKKPAKAAAKVPAAKPATKPPVKVETKATAKVAAAKAAKAPAKAAKAPAKAAKALAKAAAKANGSGSAADGSRRGERTGDYSKAVITAFAKLKNLRAGTSMTTRELAEKHADLELKPWAFKAAALRLAAENGCKFTNKDRVNTVTRL